MSAALTGPLFLRDAPIVAEIRRRGRGWLPAVAVEAGLTRNALAGASTVIYTPEDEQRVKNAYRAICARSGMIRTRPAR